MFDDIKDTFAKVSIARLQKRIDALKAHQAMLDKFTTQRALSELEHYRLQLSIGIAAVVFFGVMFVVCMGVAVATMMGHHTSKVDIVLTALILLSMLAVLTGFWESNVSRPSNIGRRQAQSIGPRCKAGLTTLKRH